LLGKPSLNNAHPRRRMIPRFNSTARYFIKVLNYILVLP
jgi:hypothetical protein